MVDNRDTLHPVTATEDTVEPTRTAYGERNFTDDARREAKAMAEGGLSHPSSKPVLKGAAIGALAGIVLPFVGPLIGAAAGGGYMFYKRVRPQ